MRKVDILQHEVEFWLKDIETDTERFEPIEEGTTDFIEEQIIEGYSSGELIESVFDKEGNIIECRGGWNIVKPKETRVYVLEDDEDNSHENLTKEEFVSKAEEEGTVYSLQGFQFAFNIGKITGGELILIL